MAPVSQINVPFGCATRKQATDRSLVATSSTLSRKRPVAAMGRVPQSKTYNLTDCGVRRRAGEVCTAHTMAEHMSPVTRVATTDRDVLRPMLLGPRAYSATCQIFTPAISIEEHGT